MQKKIAGLALILMIFLSNNVWAANWVHVATNWFGQDKMYVDTESVLKANDTIIFWELLVEDDTPDKANKTLYKLEATLAAQRQQRTLEYYLYTPQGKETFRNKRSGGFLPVQKTSPADQCIDFAIKHAKTGKDTGESDCVFQSYQDSDCRTRCELGKNSVCNGLFRCTV